MDHLKPEYLKMNPQHTIPTMNDNGYVLWESRAILGYLVDEYGKDDTLYPKDPKKRAVVNQRLYFDIGTLYPKYINYYDVGYDVSKHPNVSRWLKMMKETLEGYEEIITEGNSIIIKIFKLVAERANK
ncbi:hypothetical protein ANN_15750 [Periplaneta americana]|uniref:GST N-terminal domain-containing protein n=1 Tax=Periplaneta americana TaxID=6978 RepID=A0ABQ8SIG3_PERAM|nr:hypothetical protein ANN_15750 [Periplaneta americana]